MSLSFIKESDMCHEFEFQTIIITILLEFIGKYNWKLFLSMIFTLQEKNFIIS